MMLPYKTPARATWPLLALLAPVLVAGAQHVRGTIVDSTARTPVIGAVVEALDSTGVALSRGLTDEFGAYAIGRAAGVRRLHVVRMGYRPRDLDVPMMNGLEQRIDLAMMVVPTFLETVSTTTAPNCPRRTDTQRAFALLEQARTGLLATIVSREMSQPAIKILRYERRSDGDDQRTLTMSVHLDSNAATPTSFGAVRSARAFTENGFLSDSAGSLLYFGPDADVMLDRNFASAYCFRLRSGRSVGEIGLGFSVARPKKGRIDIDGTLWIDTVAKVVKEIAFTYVNAPSMRFLKPGGQIHFQSMPNGSVMIDRWFFRMLDARSDTASGHAGLEPVHTYFYARESGGEVAWARWPDGHAFKASLSTVKLKLVNKFDEPVTRAVIRLTDTDYLGSPDTTGTVVFNDVLPGPYNVEIQDSALVGQHIIIKSATHFIADRGKLVVRNVLAPPAYAFFKLACAASTTGRWVEYHARDDKAHPLQVSWKLGEDLGGRLEHIRAIGVTLRDGVFGYCRDLDERATLHVELTSVSDPTKIVIVGLPSTKSNILVPVVLPFRTYANR